MADPARQYLVHSVADAQQALPDPLLPPAILLHQTQQHHTAGLSSAFLLLGIHLIQTNLELGIGPVSGWKSPGDGGSPTGSEETGRIKRKGRTCHPKESIILAKLYLVTSLSKFPLQDGEAFSPNSLPHPHARGNIPQHSEACHMST